MLYRGSYQNHLHSNLKSTLQNCHVRRTGKSGCHCCVAVTCCRRVCIAVFVSECGEVENGKHVGRILVTLGVFEYDYVLADPFNVFTIIPFQVRLLGLVRPT